jgi:aldose 1-epimerase
LIELVSADTQVTLDPARGGAIASYYSKGEDGRVDWLVPADSARPACFPLLPFASRIRDGQFRFAGQPVQLPANNPPEAHAIHGQTWQQAWVPVSRSSDRASLEYCHPAGAWPWQYRARQQFMLDGRTLKIRLGLENLSDTNMPAGIGLHPFFPRTPQCEVRALVLKQWQLDAQLLPTNSKPGDYQTPGGDVLLCGDRAADAVFSGWARRVVIDLPERSAQIVMTAEQPLQHLVVYSEPAADYVCVEPISNVVDAFNLQESVESGFLYQVIAPGEWLEAEILIAPEFV